MIGLAASVSFLPNSFIPQEHSYDMKYRKARPSDVEAMQRLLLTEGKNDYNYLPETEVKKHLEGIASGETEAVLAEIDGKLAGFVSYTWGKHYPQYEPPDARNRDHGYIAEAVVSENLRGKGIGTMLLGMARDELLKKGFSRIYLKRHAENKASARIMEKAGFVEVETFLDPAIRTYGSRKTTVCRFAKEANGR